MPPNPLNPASYSHRFVTVPSGNRYHLVDEPPAHWQGPVEEAPTLLLCHGFPDLWYGWRYQIAAFASRGYRVLCPSQLGYGETSRPDDLRAYTYRSVAYDLNGVLDQVGARRVVVIGHDWGGMVAWRFAEYFPERVIAVASVCTPYLPPPSPTTPPFTDKEFIARVPNFGYQLFFASDRAAPKMEAVLDAFLAGSFSPPTREKKLAAGKKVGGMATSEEGMEKSIERLRQAKEAGQLPPMPDDPEYTYYLRTFRATGLTHPLNWYRTRTLNHLDEQHSDLAACGFPAHIPALLLPATEDPALPPQMGKSPSVVRAFKGGNLRVKEIEGADHWLLQDRRFRSKVTGILDDFVQEVLGGRWQPEPQTKL
ncbi:hypothetical protein JCM10207_004381 [Rhodosporidiobolus poonsookiae]